VTTDERPSAGSRASWAVLALLILALALGAVAIVADDQPTAGSPVTTGLVGGGGVDAINVSGMNNNVVFHAGSPKLNKSGFDNTLQQG